MFRCPLITEDIGLAEPYVPHAWTVTQGYRSPSDEAAVPEWPLADPRASWSTAGCVELPSDPDEDSATGAYEHQGNLCFAYPAHPWECPDTTD